MGVRLFKVLKLVAKMEGFANGALSCAADIKRIQAECPHAAQSFSFQSNAYHVKLWNVIYQCSECGMQRTEKKEPVCEICDTTLLLCDETDTIAETERQRPEHQGYLNRPLAFRCPSCRKIHILRHQGD